MGQSKSKYEYQPSTDWPYVWALRDGDFLDWKHDIQTKGDEDTLQQIQAIQKRQNDLPVQVSPTLFLGNCDCVRDIDKLQRLGIQRVLNMAGPLAVADKTVQALQERGIRYKMIAAQDEEDYPLLEKHEREASAFIRQGTDAGEKVLVHCIAGRNRSALIVAVHYLYQTPQTNVIETVRHIRYCRGNVALQNDGFQEQLVAFARVHQLPLGDAPVPGCPPPPASLKSEKKKNPLDRLTV